MPVATPFIRVFQSSKSISFAIAITVTTHAFPSRLKKKGGTIFRIDSEDSCTPLRQDSNYST